MSETLRELPKYKCHKMVHAAKIKAIDSTADFGAFIHFEEDFDSIQVDKDYIGKHKPQVGGYFVVYEDDYRSFSPCEVFELGYVLIPTTVQEAPNDKETFIRFIEMAKRKLSQEDFEKAYGTIFPIADTIPNFDELPDFNN